MLENFAQTAAIDARNTYGVTIPWEMILELVLQLIEDCFPDEESFVQSAKSPNMLQKVAFNIVARRVTGIKRRGTLVSLRNVVFDNAAALTDNELAAGYNEAKAVFGTVVSEDEVGDEE